MIAVFVGLALLQSAAPIERDSYGVPHILASTWDEAFYYSGYAVAQDRLWQMENSRRLARGKMAEVFGSSMVNSDKEVLQTGYTDEELDAQLEKLSPKAKAAMAAYTKGINAYIGDATKSGSLPAGYKENGFEPVPWSELDSVAISVRLLKEFGKGGAGEIRNMALYSYLGTQAKAKGAELTIFNDFAWQNDPTATTTIQSSDDPIKKPPAFPVLTDEVTKKHLAMLPKVSLFEMLPGLRLVLNEESHRVAEMVRAPFKVGSYCIVVSPKRSATAHPLLLSGPQMGFTVPSIIHEMSIQCPGLDVVGMDLPGVPGVLIGHTKDIAWGLTSGVADTDDIFYFPTIDDHRYKFGAETKEIQVIKSALKVKGGDDVSVEQRRTVFGPIVVESKHAQVIFARRSSYAGREMESYDALMSLYDAKRAADISPRIAKATMSFNFFFASRNGEIGYRFLGLVPIRAAGIDPRFPTPGSPQFDWKGFVPSAQMPRVDNPSSGLIVNWNNKPVSWWPNFDTPVWGRIFRNSIILDQLQKPKLDTQDLEQAIWRIARTDYNFAYFAPYLKLVPGSDDAALNLRAFDGRLMAGSIGASLYLAFFDALRTEIFAPTVGNFLSPDNFRLAVQPSVMLKALEGKTGYNYLGNRKVGDIVATAYAKAIESLKKSRGEDLSGWRYAAPGIRVPDQQAIPYSDRGSYIQIVELMEKITGRNIVTPGVSESGDHSLDQVPLARAWLFKAMTFREH